MHTETFDQMQKHKLELEKVCEESRLAVLAAYREGYKDALNHYAIWHNGVQVVGSGVFTLKQVIEEVDNSPVPIRH